MFIELHMLEDDKRIMVSIDKIQCIGHVNDVVVVDVVDSVFRVKESYDQIRQAMSKITTIENVESENNKIAKEIARALADADQDTLMPAT